MQEYFDHLLKYFPFSFVCRADAIEVAAEDALCGKGYELTLFVFTDIIVVAKVKILFYV